MEDEKKIDVRGLALNRISVREYGSLELKKYLVKKGAEPEQAEQVVAEFVSEKLIDDLRYARVIARHQAFRDKGPSYILAKLREKGVKLSLREVQALYEETLPENFSSELEKARAVLAKRYPRAFSDPAVARRAYQALLRRGFSRETVRKCLFERGSDSLD